MNRFGNAAIAVCVLLVLFAATSASADSAIKYKDGIYALDYKDDELGSVSISVTVKAGIITAIELPKGKGSLTLEDDILVAFIDSLVKASDYLEVDALSGASADSDLIKYAIQNALKAAR